MDWLEWLRQHAWESWLTAAVLLGVLELMSLDLIFAMLAGGAFVGLVVALVGGGLPLQLVFALLSAVAMIGLIRPNVVRRLHGGPDLRTGTDALIGRRATVLRELAFSQPGRVKIGGEEWAAMPYDEDDRIEPGTVVDVVQIKGATAYVLRTQQLGS